MTEADARIEQLKTQAPSIQRTAWEKAERVLGWVTAIIAVVALVVTVNNVAALAAQSRHTLALAKCINHNLGSRQRPAQVQRDAELSWVTAVFAAFTTTTVPPAKERQILRDATGAFRSALVKASNESANNPLGKCT